MMKRICFMLPNLVSTRKVLKGLKKIGIAESHMHVVGKDIAALERAHVNRASILQTTDIMPALKRGILFGLVLAVTIYSLFYFFRPEGFVIPLKAILACGITGIFFGLWASAMIGIGIPNAIVEEHEAEIEQGHYLLMLDIPEESEKALPSYVKSHYPEAQEVNMIKH